jgi:hypothetical protein
MSRFVVFTATAALFIASPALAQTTPAKPPVPTVAAFMTACQADVVRLCGEVPFRMAALGSCLRSKSADLTPACRAMQTEGRERARATRAAMRPLQKAAMEACAADVKSLCGDVGRSQSKAFACVRANDGKVAPACKSAVDDLRKAQREARR